MIVSGSLGDGQRQRQQDPRLLRIEIIRDQEPRVTQFRAAKGPT